MLKIAGVDVGNDSIKVALEGYSQTLTVPNIVAPGYDRHILQEEDTPLKALDVMIYSPKLAQSNKRYFVGMLAMENDDNVELEETDNKAVSDQSLIVTLTALAYAGLINQHTNSSTYDNSVDVLEYYVGTGLPVRTFPMFHQSFEERLLGEHEVTFLSTPQFKNRKVRINIKKVLVSIEGAAALFHMATHDSLQVKDEELYYGCIGVCEIGALTTDFPVINRMNIDNQFSTGETMGLAGYLDSIIRDVEDIHGYYFPSRAKLVQRIVKGDYIVQKIGEGQADIRPIVDTYFSRAAQKIVDLIKKRWKRYPDIQCYYVVGGGADALKPYIIQAAGPIKLRFVDNSEVLNVQGYLKLAKNRLNQAEQQM